MDGGPIYRRSSHSDWRPGLCRRLDGPKRKVIYDSEFSLFVPLRNLAPFLTGSIDYANSVAWMLRGALLLGTMLLVCDLSQSSRWLLRLWYVMGLVGGSIAFLGLLQKATGAQMIFWQPPPPPKFGVTTFFATYFYHGNAGIFRPGVAIERRSRYPGVYEPISARDARAMDSRFHRNYCGCAGEYVTNGAGGRAFINGRHWPAFWTGALRKLSGAQKSVAMAGALAIILTLIALAQATIWSNRLTAGNRWLNESLPMLAGKLHM